MKRNKKYGIPRTPAQNESQTLDKIRNGFGLDPIVYPKENLVLKAPGYILIDGPAYCKYRLPCGMCERTGKDCKKDRG